MIEIQKSETADTRTCDFANVSKEKLLASSQQHIGDIVKALAFFVSKIVESAGCHDYDKLTLIDWFHQDFVTGFEQTGWWDNHRKIHRHHIDKADGVPADVNLLDVLEHIADCVMAGMARSGSVYELKLDDELLQRAFQNTVAMLTKEISVQGSEVHAEQAPTDTTRKPESGASGCGGAEESKTDEEIALELWETLLQEIFYDARELNMNETLVGRKIILAALRQKSAFKQEEKS